MTMTVSCPSCGASFPVDPNKIPAGGVKARCSQCSGIIDVQPPPPEAAAPEPPVVEEAPAFEAAPPVAEEPVAPEPTPDFEPPAETASSYGADAEIDTNLGAEGADEFGEREISFDAPAPPMEEPAAEVAPAEPEEAAPPAAPADDAFAAVADAPAADPAPAAPIQFGRRTPEQKAQSLARSLVSDIIAYHGDKHAQAKASGTLATVFEEEVEKCWKEYQEQVDPGVVQNNTFLCDALNELLADGQPVFNVPG